MAKNKKIKKVSHSKYHTLVEELKMSRIDAIFLEKAQAIEFVKIIGDDYRYKVFEDDYYCYAIALPKNSALKQKIQDALNQLKEDGELQKLEQKWFAVNSL